MIEELRRHDENWSRCPLPSEKDRGPPHRPSETFRDDDAMKRACLPPPTVSVLPKMTNPCCVFSLALFGRILQNKMYPFQACLCGRVTDLYTARYIQRGEMWELAAPKEQEPDSRKSRSDEFSFYVC